MEPRRGNEVPDPDAPTGADVRNEVPPGRNTDDEDQRDGNVPEAEMMSWADWRRIAFAPTKPSAGIVRMAMNTLFWVVGLTVVLQAGKVITIWCGVAAPGTQHEAVQQFTQYINLANYYVAIASVALWSVIAAVQVLVFLCSLLWAMPPVSWLRAGARVILGWILPHTDRK